jgi:hypothetical protein
MDAVENHLEMLDAACRSGNEVATDRAIEQLASLVGNVVVAGTNGEPANGLPVLCSADTVRCDLRWSQARGAVARAANGTSVERWTLEPGSVVTASVSGVVVEVRLAGSIEIPNENVPAVGHPARTPSSVALVAEWGAGAFDASAGPNCGDADADGIPNIAERIRGYFERGSGRPDAGKKGI